MRPTKAELIAGALIDLCLGDPHWLPHPVRGLGRWIERQEQFWRASGVRLRLAGVFFWCATVALASAFVWVTLQLAPRPYSYVYWISTLLAVRDLDRHARRVALALAAGDLVAARRFLSHIVGRDTEGLEEKEIVRAVAETVAENLSDGVVAPLFYLVLGGPVTMAAYKAVNTLDSMVGYQNDRYRDFGWFAARADDFANFLPARITAALICLCALLPGFHFYDAIRTSLRDGGSQPSPNAGWPEAAAAGALGVQLGGLNYYQGVPRLKARLGEARRPLEAGLFPRLRLLLYATSLAAVALAIGGVA